MPTTKAMPKKSQLRWRVLAVSYGLLFCTILWFAYSGNLPNWFESIPYYDKVGHVGLYAIAAYLGHRFFNYRHIRLLGLSLPCFPGIFGLFTAAEELSQGLSPNRTLDAVDLVCSFIGVGLGYWLAQRGIRGIALGMNQKMNQAAKPDGPEQV